MAPSRPQKGTLGRMSFRFEFDYANRILLVRVEGQLSDELLAECYDAIRQYSVATDARMSIFDLSSVSQFAVSSEFIRQLAKCEPAMPDATTRARIIAVENTTGFGLARMFQIAGENGRPMLQVVRTMHDALVALGIQSPHFEPLE
jgi:hypothetical protein